MGSFTKVSVQGHVTGQRSLMFGLPRWWLNSLNSEISYVSLSNGLLRPLAQRFLKHVNPLPPTCSLSSLHRNDWRMSGFHDYSALGEGGSGRVDSR